MPIDERAARDPFVRQFFARIGPELRDTYTTTQLAALKMVFNENIRTDHTVDLRVVFPPFLTRTRFYLVFVSGQDRRGDGRAMKAGKFIARVARRALKITVLSAMVIILIMAVLFFLA